MAAIVHRSLLGSLLLPATSCPNPKPLPHSSSSSATQVNPCQHEKDLLSWRLLRLRPWRGASAAAAIERWALEILSWMNSHGDVQLSPLDHAATLDLIAKVHGTSQAEEYYKKLQKACNDPANC